MIKPGICLVAFFCVCPCLPVFRLAQPPRLPFRPPLPLPQNALELLEARLAGGVGKLEARLAAVEERAAAQHGAAAQGV